MSISSAMTTAASGMRAQTVRLASIADNIANTDTAGASPKGSDTDPGSDILDMIEAKTGYQANAMAFETGADLWQVLAAIKR